jgi:predicted O-linked N-acetylglucosamine transferase (SPINDLY family)
MGTVSDVLEIAIEHHRAGRLQQAEALYRQILQAEPNHPDALHFLGVLAYQAGQHDSAIRYIIQAIAHNGQVASFHNNLGEVYRVQGKLGEAMFHYRQALALKAEYPEAHNNLGLALQGRGQLTEAVAHYLQALAFQPEYAEAHNNLGATLQEQGNFDEAIMHYRQAVTLKPTYAEAHYNLGVALKEQGQLEEAVAAYRQGVAVRPDYAEGYNNLGVALKEQGQLEEAVAAYRQGLALRPDYAELHYNLGNVLLQQGQLGDAVAAYRRALALRPDFPEAYYDLGVALQEQGRLAEAVAYYQRALALNPALPGVYNNLGWALQDQGKLGEAIAQYRQALALKPAYAEAHNNLGAALHARGQLENAVVHYEKALAIRPTLAEAYNNLGTAFQEQGKIEEAIAAYRQALAIKPVYPAAEAQLLHQLQHLCEWADLDGFFARQRENVRTHSSAKIPPFILLSIPSSPAEQLACARNWVATRIVPVARLRDQLRFHFTRTEKFKLRLGYISADLRQHPVAYLIAELCELHDRNAFEVFAYSYGPEDGSAIRQRLVRAFDRFVDIAPLPFEAAARRIYEDQVDILVDLTGYTRGTRAQILALRPAPIQVNYMGYPGTMGAEFMDYFITHRFLTPPEQAPYYTEQFVYLPEWCVPVSQGQGERTGATPRRTEAGLPEAGFIFCCFSNPYKITPDVFAVWMRLLRKTPNGVLWLWGANPGAPANLRREAAARGVAPERLIFGPTVPMEQHLARLRVADLGLDTFPYTGHTTTGYALWAGLPVLTCVGETFVSRVSGSKLLEIGLPDLITSSLSDYEARALYLTQHPDELAALRDRLAQSRLTAPIFDTPRFTRHLETAYQLMWEIYLRGEPPRQIEVPASPNPVHPEPSRRMP